MKGERMKKAITLALLTVSLLPSCGSNINFGDNKTQSNILDDAKFIASRSQGGSNEIYIVNGDEGKVYKVNMGSGMTAQDVKSLSLQDIIVANDVEHESFFEAKSDNRVLVPSALAVCEQNGDGSYYRNYVKSGILGYSTDITLPTVVSADIDNSAAFIYTGFTGDYKEATETQHEVGFQWTNGRPKDGENPPESTTWNLYLRAGNSTDGTGNYPNTVTNGNWINAWKFTKYNLDKGQKVSIKSSIYNSDNLTYVVTDVISGSQKVTIGVRSGSNISLGSLKPSNQDKIWARKIVSLAYRDSNNAVAWPSSDKQSRIKFARFDNSKYTRNGVIYNWPYNGCKFTRDNFTVVEESGASTYGDSVSIYRPQ